MHKLFIILIFLFSYCYAQNLNHVVFDENAKMDILKGYCDVNGLKSTVWKDIFEAEYDNYQPDIELLHSLIPLMDDVSIVIIIGTWCSDSKQFVPPFMRILKEIQFDMSNVKMVGLDRNFAAADADISLYGVEKVPTFIFFSGTVEIGRIIETPEGSLENHIVKIFAAE